MGLLNSMAVFVDGIARGDVNIINQSGFRPTKGTRTPVAPPSKPSNVRITRGTSGRLMPECDPQPNIDAYVCVLTENAPLPPDIIINGTGQLVIGQNHYPGTDGKGPSLMQDITMAIFDFNKKRKTLLVGLRPGLRYYAAFFVINASGVSSVSEPASIICG